MHILQLECSRAERDFVVADLWEHAVLGIEEDEQPDGRVILKAWFEFAIETPAFERYAPQWYRAPEQDWEALSREQWDTVEVGSRFFLVPEWRDDPPPAGRMRLAMRPGRACGTGWAAPTQLALECMETAVKPGATVLDLGTGAGILAVAAHLLGAGRIYACDIDHDATAVASERFRDEGIEIRTFTGSTRSVRDGSVDLVIANLNAATLVDLAGEIRRILAPGGKVILSGFRERDLARVRRAWNCEAEAREKDGWLALVC
ncbi:MAG TPA: 50S ribosomal protein L11 methyltransferase [Bryobacteraceae bacterium]|nr:50S ribosomal protein L11 methyltransferase [Bryobacteraceae bacterium]